jgi:DNA-binding transcriptional regulator YiaG
MQRRQRNAQGGRKVFVRSAGQDYVACNGSYGHGYRVATWLKKAGHDDRRGLQAFLTDLKALQRTLDLRLELRATGRQSAGKAAWDSEALAVLEAYGRTPALAGDFRLKIFLPVDLETQLRARLAAVGIEAVDDGEERASLLQPLGGLSPADLRLARQGAGWTQSELARRLGVTKVTISQWECGKKPIPATRLPRLRVMVARCWAVFNRQRTVGLSPQGGRAGIVG